MQPNHSYSWRETVQTIAEAWRNWRERRHDIVEFDRADVTDVSEIARDLGLSASELRTLVGCGKNSAELLERRLQTLGFEPSHIEPSVMRDLQRCCSQCHDKALCAHELEDKPKGASWPSYCPNDQTIHVLLAEWPSLREAGERSQALSEHASGDDLPDVAGMDEVKDESKARIEAEARLKKAQSQFSSLE